MEFKEPCGLCGISELECGCEDNQKPDNVGCAEDGCPCRTSATGCDLCFACGECVYCETRCACDSPGWGFSKTLRCRLQRQTREQRCKVNKKLFAQIFELARAPGLNDILLIAFGDVITDYIKSSKVADIKGLLDGINDETPPQISAMILDRTRCLLDGGVCWDDCKEAWREAHERVSGDVEPEVPDLGFNKDVYFALKAAEELDQS